MKVRACLFVVFFAAACAFSQGGMNAQKIYADGIEAERSREWQKASERFQEALKENPRYADAWYHLALCVYQMKSYDLALPYVQNARHYAPGRSDIMNLEGRVLLALSRLAEAESIFNTVQTRYPNDLEARFGLAELALKRGSLLTAQGIYRDALLKDASNVKALLSLALISADLGNTNQSQQYVNDALRVAFSDAQAHYVAAYLDFKRGDYNSAEKRCLSAIQLLDGYGEAYTLLSQIYFSQGRYEDVIDFADFGLSRRYGSSHLWYLKGLTQQRMGLEADALATWLSGLEAFPEDDVMRNAFELLAAKIVPLGDARRTEWAAYHIQKAQGYATRYASAEMRYEYQAALRLNPTDYTARSGLARLMRGEGYSESYLAQMKFIQENEIIQARIDALKRGGSEISDADGEAQVTRLSDTIEGYEALLKNTLASKWDINPFYLDKTRWNVGVYCIESKNPILHPNLTQVAGEHLSVLFRGFAEKNIRADVFQAKNFSETYSAANARGYEYFFILEGEDSESEINLVLTVFSAKTGGEVQRFAVRKTGNDRYVSALLALRTQIAAFLPTRAKIVRRSGSSVLIDIGRTEGVSQDLQFAVVKQNALGAATPGDENARGGFYYADADFLGTLSLVEVNEEISEGVLSVRGFYDRVNARDEVVLLVAEEQTENPADNQTTRTRRGIFGRRKQAEQPQSARQTQGVSSALVDMVMSL